MRAGRTAGSGEFSMVLPWLMAVADPGDVWWKRLRKNPKRLGEVSQAAFLVKAKRLGFGVALPWGDSERYDFVVWAKGGPMLRVQVKATGRLYLRGYEVQVVHSTRGQGKKRIRRKTLMWWRRMYSRWTFGTCCRSGQWGGLRV